MFPLPLDEDEYLQYELALCNSHQMRFMVSILDRNEVVLSDTNNVFGSPDVQFLSGDVQVDAEADVTRSASITILNYFGNTYSFLPDSPQNFGVSMDNFIRVTRGIYVDALGAWVDVPVFTGVINGIDDKDNEVTFDARGKEALAMAPHFFYKNAAGLNIPKGTMIVDAIETVMGAIGEEKFLFEKPTTKKLNKPLALSGRQEPWTIAKRLARQINRQLFYDGEGNLRLRPYPKKALYTFTDMTNADDGVYGNVMTPAELQYDLEEFRNVVVVKGPRPEGQGQKKRPQFTRKIKSTKQLSPEYLARNGSPRYVTEFIDISDTGVRDAECQKIADDTFERVTKGNISVNFESLVIPHIEEWDRLKIQTRDIQTEFVAKKFSIPLSNSGTMAHGFAKAVNIITKPQRIKAHMGVH